MNAKNSRDSSIRKNTNNGGNTRSRRDVNNSRTQATAETPITA
jgi:hypothetical protein